ncbi:MAG: NAD(P)-binding domain-containing protein [Chloroflexota bacterium]
MKIGILGAGNIGGTLGVSWARAGHTVVFGARNSSSEKVQARLAEANGKAAAASVAEAIEQADVVLIAIPAMAMTDFLAENGRLLNNKLIIDATNAIGSEQMNSVATIQAAAPEATVVRAFNNLGWENFAEPTINGVQVDLIYCAPEAARETAERLISDIGLNPVYLGGDDQLPVVDNLVRLWFALAFGQKNGRRLAFKVIKEA